jgi:hypothetical protein
LQQSEARLSIGATAERSRRRTHQEGSSATNQEAAEKRKGHRAEGKRKGLRTEQTDLQNRKEDAEEDAQEEHGRGGDEQQRIVEIEALSQAESTQQSR